MKFVPKEIPGVYEIQLEQKLDDRGFFARMSCIDEFSRYGLESRFVQINTSYTKRKGTVRGLHYQIAPFEENKLIKCISGSIFDALVDLRPASPTYMKCFGMDINAKVRNMLYIPAGCAHGYQALENGTEVIYLSTEFYSPAAERAIRHNDPTFKINWPLTPGSVSEKDSRILDFRPSEGE